MAKAAKAKKESMISIGGTDVQISSDGKTINITGDLTKVVLNGVVGAPIGQKMADGSVYAGLTPDGKSQIFALPKNLNATLTFNDAVKAVNKLNSEKALGHDDWQIPNHAALEVLQKNQKEGFLKGTFNTSGRGDDYTHPTMYWSSTKDRALSQWQYGIYFDSPGIFHDSYGKEHVRLRCRPVRLVPVSA